LSKTPERLADGEIRTVDAIVAVLDQAGIDTVFGMPGGNTIRIFDALYEHPRIRTVLLREESLAGVMAEVYGRLTGRPGVVIGQGAFLLSNAVMGTLEALSSCSPMLLVTELSDGFPLSQHAPYQSGTGEYGNWDARLSFGGFTKLTLVSHSPAQAIQNTQLAIKHAMTGQPGPVALLFHSQALRGKVDPNAHPRLYPTARYLPQRAGADPAAVNRACLELAKAERPIIVAGNGVRLSRAYRQLIDLAETLGAPVASTAAGKGVFPETHELALGVMGTFGTPLANQIVGRADLVLVVGSKLSPNDTANESPELIDPDRQVIVQIDVEPLNASWTYPADVALVGDAARTLESMVATVEASERSGWINEVRAARSELGWFDVEDSRSAASPPSPLRTIRELGDAIPPDAIVTADAGENRLFMLHHFQTRSSDSFLQPAGIGGMGYAIPAAMAAKLCHPGRTVVAVCGDGGFGMAMNGLLSAVENDLRIAVVVLNNSALGWVAHGQGVRPIASDLGDFDYAAIARAVGCEGIRVEIAADIAPALEIATRPDRPTVVDIVTALEPSFESVVSPLARRR
jgi:acetolactate synthase I/II/III large subunit